jgi:hypothetical protein
MKAIRFSQKTDKEGSLSLVIPLGKPEQEYEVVVVLEPKFVNSHPEELGWSPGYFQNTYGSIDDETFVRPNQGEVPKQVDFE